MSVGRIPADTSYTTVEDEGVAQPQRTTINFTGAGVTASDVGGKTTVDIPGSSGAPANAQYLTLATDATLTVERVFTPGVGLQATDAGAGAAYTANAYQAMLQNYLYNPKDSF